MTTKTLKDLVREKRDELERAPHERPGPQSSPNPRYGRVFFALRERYDLTTEACLLLDVVEILSRKTGWCFASRDYLAGLLGVSVSSIKRLLADLESKGLVERHPERPRQLRPTTRWHQAKASVETDQTGPRAGSV